MRGCAALQGVLTSFIVRELKQRWRRARGHRLGNNKFILYQRNSQLPRSAHHASDSKNVFRLNMQWQWSVPNANTKKLTVVVSVPQTTQNLIVSRSCAQLLFYSLNLLFDDVLVAVVVVVCLNSLVNAHFMVPAISQRNESGCKNVRGLGKHKGSILFVRCFCSGSFRKSRTSLIVIYNGKNSGQRKHTRRRRLA